MSKRKTKSKQLMSLFIANGRRGLTSWEAIQAANYTRLSALVHDKQRQGYTFGREWVKDTDGTRYMRYWLTSTPEGGAANDETIDEKKAH